jgi:hypothetical protein
MFILGVKLDILVLITLVFINVLVVSLITLSIYKLYSFEADLGGCAV